MPTAQGLPSPVTLNSPEQRICRPVPQPLLPKQLDATLPETVWELQPEGEAHLGLMPGTFSALEAPALLLKESLSTRLPLRDGAESEMV